MEIPKNRRTLVRVGLLATGAAALTYAFSQGGNPSQPDQSGTTGPIDPNVLTLDDVRRFYPILEQKPEPDVYVIHTDRGVSLVANYSGTKLNQSALSGVYGYFEGLAVAGGTINMIDQTSGKLTAVGIRPREVSKRLLFVIDQDTKTPPWAGNDLATTTLRFKDHAVGFARVLSNRQFPGTHFPENHLNSTMNITVEACQALVWAYPPAGDQKAVATEAQERLCNGFAFGHLARQTGKLLPDYEKLFPRQVGRGLTGPTLELIKIEPEHYNTIQVNGLIVP